MYYGECCSSSSSSFPQAVSNTLKVRYPLSRDDLATLAGLQAAVDVAQGSRAGEPSGADINKYFPAHHLTSASPVKKSIGRIFKQKSTDKDATSLQQDFSRAFSEACKRSSDAHQLRVLYLQHCWHKPYYGCVCAFLHVYNNYMKMIQYMTV